MTTLFWFNGWLVRTLGLLAVLIVAAMMLGISAEVVLRTLSFPSIPGMIELTEYGLFISTFFVAPYLLRTNQHIRVDIVMSRVDPATAWRVECGVLATIIAVSLITGFVGVSVMLASIRDGTMVFKDLVFPQWWLEWIIPLTSLAMALQAFEMLIALWRGAASARDEAAGQVPGLGPEEVP